jgi:hypothetical protein
MNDPKQKKQLKLLGVLLLVLMLALYWSWGIGPAATSTLPGRLPSASLGLEDFVLRTGQPVDGRIGKGIPVSEINSSIHFEKLGQMETVQPSLARNMFAFYTPPRPSGKTPGNGSPENSGSARPQPVVPERISPAGRSSVTINLKFYGFRKDPKGEQRQGFFADGEDLFLAREGELIANRYRIHRITDTMAEVEEVGSKTRKRLNLETPTE